MENQNKPPKVFISYSWTSEEHKDWVLELAKSLRNDGGVDIILDRWDLKYGNDTFKFMEQMVTSKDIEKVLIICDSGYQSKADQRKGGVGTETQIITPEIYNSIEQEKFIPIISQRDENGKPFIPVFIKTRMYIDLSNNENYNENFEEILRAIFRRPSLQKPEIGTPPKYLFEESKISLKTTKINQEIEIAITKKPNILDNLSNNFVESLINELKKFRISSSNIGSEMNFDDIVYQSINELMPLRNDFIRFVELNLAFPVINLDRFKELFEQLTEFLFPEQEIASRGYRDIDFDNYRFFINEIFLYFVTILLKNKKFVELNTFLNNTFFFRKNHYDYDLIDGKYDEFNFNIETFNRIRNNRLKENKVFLHSDILIKRTSTKYSAKDISSADLILYYLGQMTNNARWYPYLYLYLKGKLEYFQKLKSKNYFEKIKILFNVDKSEELINQFKNFDNSLRGTYRGYNQIPEIIEHIAPDNICSTS